MLRRAALPLTVSARRLCGATALSAGCVARCQSNSSPAAANNNNGERQNFNRGQNRRQNNNNRRRALMPPAFDIVHWNDEDITKGHLLRVLHRDSFIVLDYHRQARANTSANGAEGETGEAGNRAERVVTVTLPPVYIARFLGVLEGRMDKVEVQSRFTNATFVPNAAKGPHHFSLSCISTKPTTAQQQSVDGTDINEETINWSVDLDPAEALMLHRFLSQALQYNTGFTRRIF